MALKTSDRALNATDFGIEIRDGDAYVPDALGRVLDSMGARTIPAAIAALEDFPSAFMKIAELPRDRFFKARDRALEKLRQAPGGSTGTHLQNVGFGALSPERKGRSN